jgi:hypothetical protein
MKHVIALAFLPLLWCNSDLSHSALVSASNTSRSVPIIVAASPVLRRQVLKGWLPEYDAFIESEVHKYPGLLKIEASRLSNFCPGFAKIRDKAQFYADLLWSIAGPESDRQRTQITLETNLDGVANPIDPVTGQQVRSEGLLQLSYQDTVNYDAAQACPFDWEADKVTALEEFSRGAQYGDGTRSIHDAYKNLQCAVFILNAHLSQLYPSAKFEDALRRYWSTMDPSESAYKKVRANLKKRQKACK